MNEAIEIIAISNYEDGYPDAELYFANSEEEADQFCKLWDEKEVELAQIWGGYPGQAFTASLALPASRWIRERQAELEKVKS